MPFGKSRLLNWKSHLKKVRVISFFEDVKSTFFRGVGGLFQNLRRSLLALAGSPAQRNTKTQYIHICTVPFIYLQMIQQKTVTIAQVAAIIVRFTHKGGLHTKCSHQGATLNGIWQMWAEPLQSIGGTSGIIFRSLLEDRLPWERYKQYVRVQFNRDLVPTVMILPARRNYLIMLMVALHFSKVLYFCQVCDNKFCHFTWRKSYLKILIVCLVLAKLSQVEVDK